ncbi:hypothetical protein HID58_003979 [Brassica napus]|uniref:PPM-type phosphatase domain-containing protein n=1 Tax=Brassica napus TaxID=3708 RepID=A0ABQ7XI86_BRANA|nr:probable protein phosphatase 2C 34 [Brassica napus]KAH0855679.1 hypothetical protein HID58_003979 [Brassica napus]
MGHFSSMFNSLARSFSNKKDNNNGKSNAKEAADEMAREATKKAMILKSSGCVNADGSNNLASVFSRRGEKGVNQDCAIVWEGFGCQEDMMFCGIFDGHGPWGHFVSKQVRNSMPISLLCNWQETLSQTTLVEPETDQRFAIWKHLYLKTCADVDQELQHHRKIDTFNSGTTALTVVRQGEVIYVANVGDSRAVLATLSEEGGLTAVQLTVDFKPNIPQEEERIIGCNGRVFCLEDEPGVHRVWQPEEESPGLAMSRAFGDYCIKEYGLVSIPEVTQRHISNRDQFVILATDGVWDVISNEEAIDIVASTAERPKAAKRLVEQAVKAWNKKRRGIAMDDISAVCLFFHS